MDKTNFIKSLGNAIVFFGLIIVLIIWAIVISAARNDYNIELKRAEENARNLSAILEKHINVTFSKIESSLFLLRRNWESGLNLNDMQALLQLFTESKSDLFNLISVINTSGNVIVTNQKEFKPTYSGDRPFFIFHKENISDELHIGAPLSGRLTGKWYFPVSIRLQDTHGNFSGVLLASINPFYFSGIFKDLQVGEKSFVYLTDKYGTVYNAMLGGKDLGLDIKIPENELKNIIHSTPNKLITKSFYDGVKRVVGRNSIPDRNMYVSVEISVQEWLENFQKKMLVFCIILLLLSFFIIWITFRLRNAIQSKEALTRELDCFFSTALDLLCIADCNGKFVRVNREWEKTLGYTANELENTLFLDFVHPDDKQKTMDAVADLKNNIVILNFTNRYRKKDGTYRYIEWRSVPHNNYIYAAARDITERIKNEEALRASEEKLNEKNRELENYLYIASHDLRAPLLNIDGFSKRLKKQIGAIKTAIIQSSFEDKNSIAQKMDENIPKTLDYIYNNVRKMENLLNGLLQISRTGRLPMFIKKINMNNLIRSIINSKEFQLTELSADVIVNNLDDCFGDESLLTQLFSNIIANAINYRAENRKLEIIISSKIQKNTVIYSIKDNGIGISEKNISKIWDIFFRVNSHTNEPGEGLGLSIVKKIVEKHKGKVRIESEEGTGSVFIIELQRFNFEI